MRKEYSDLPKAQKSTYILDNVITLGTIVMIMVGFAAWLLYATWDFLGNAFIQSDLFSGLVLFGLGFFMIGGVILAYMIKNALGLFTDFDLERAERRLKKVKDALDK
jgi:HAMP domain-containing protein